MSWSSKILLILVGLLFLLRGGLVMLIGFWKIMLPLLLVGGGMYFLKKSFLNKKLEFEKQRPAPAKNAKAGPSSSKSSSDVIQICPHCLQEIGSCPQCS